MSEKIKPEHKSLLNKIRELYIQSGGRPLYEPEDFGLNDLDKNRSKDGILVDFDYGVPHRMYTPDGSYMILGSSVCGDLEMFWTLLNQAFQVKIIKPKRDDRKTPELVGQTSLSGPIVQIG